MSDGPLAAYRAQRATGTLLPDPCQAIAAEKLQSLHNALRDYRPATADWRTRWQARFGRRRQEAPPQGLYLFGPVGRGKSMLMDLFFTAAPVAHKRRVHFHAFMLEVQGRLKTAREADADDPLMAVAAALAAEAFVLCFDEFNVANIADAMILGRLFRGLFDAGVVVVATSNSGPDDLYKDGLQRDRFVPFIALIKDRLDLLDLAQGTDHRLDRIKGRTVYHCPLSEAATAGVAAAFAALTDGAAAPTSRAVLGRTLQIRQAGSGVARCTFAELCGRPLGAADYLAVATHFHCVVVDDIPALEPARRDEAKRFVTLIDALYEHRVKLICSAAAPPQGLYPAGDTAFEFRRTASRLVEMQAADYLAAPHLT